MGIRYKSFISNPKFFNIHNVNLSCWWRRPVLCAVTDNHFFNIYGLPSFELAGSWFMGPFHQSCVHNNSIYVDDMLYLCGAFVSAWKCENSGTEGVKPCKGTIADVKFMKFLIS